MRAYWITFEDGSKACCEGRSAGDAQRIAEHITGKKVRDPEGEFKYRSDENPAIRLLPYPSTPIIWQFDHPIHGKCPTFCHSPNECCGRSSCPQRYACSE